MNPNVNMPRGCFIENVDNQGKVAIVDYPTYTFNKYGRILEGQNDPIPEGKPSRKEFESRRDALEYCREQNYVVCSAPGTGIKYVPEDDDDEIPELYD